MHEISYHINEHRLMLTPRVLLYIIYIIIIHLLGGVPVGVKSGTTFSKSPCLYRRTFRLSPIFASADGPCCRLGGPTDLFYSHLFLFVYFALLFPFLGKVHRCPRVISYHIITLYTANIGRSGYNNFTDKK